MTANARDMLDRIRDEGLHSVRVVFTDQHGLLHGKTVDADAMAEAVEAGVGVPGSLLHKDTGNTYAVAVWEPTGDEVLDEIVGARNIVMRPDPATFCVLPWLQGTGIVLSDLETTACDPIPHSTRSICADAITKLGGHDLALKAGLELEFHLFGVGDDGERHHSHPGWDLLSEDRLDRIEPAIEPIRLGLTALGMAPRTVEAELGPSQVEITFDPQAGLVVADQAVIARSAIRHIARRNGFHATFMSRPRIEGVGGESFPSGWHLHQSLVGLGDTSGRSLLTPDDSSKAVSLLGERFVAGLLANAAASCMLTTPTVTGYKRYRPRAVTPDRISWSREHRGAMLRVVGGPGDNATRIENRAGDPAANPYLYVASQVLSALDGIENQLTPPTPTESPYDPAGGELLPRTLGDAIAAFSDSTMYRKALGDQVTDYLATLKRSEWQRFNATVTDWEQREYFNHF